MERTGVLDQSVPQGEGPDSSFQAISTLGPSNVIKMEDMHGSEISAGAIRHCHPRQKIINPSGRPSGQTADLEEQDAALMLFSLSQGATQAMSSKPASHQPTVRNRKQGSLSLLEVGSCAAVCSMA